MEDPLGQYRDEDPLAKYRQSGAATNVANRVGPASTGPTPDSAPMIAGKQFLQSALDLPMKLLYNATLQNRYAGALKDAVTKGLEPVLSTDINDTNTERAAFVAGDVLGGIVGGGLAFKGASKLLSKATTSILGDKLAADALSRVAAVAENAGANVAQKLTKFGLSAEAAGAIGTDINAGIRSAPLSIGTNLGINAVADPSSFTNAPGIGMNVANTLLGLYLDRGDALKAITENRLINTRALALQDAMAERLPRPDLLKIKTNVKEVMQARKGNAPDDTNENIASVLKFYLATGRIGTRTLSAEERRYGELQLMFHQTAAELGPVDRAKMNQTLDVPDILLDAYSRAMAVAKAKRMAPPSWTNWLKSMTGYVETADAQAIAAGEDLGVNPVALIKQDALPEHSQRIQDVIGETKKPQTALEKLASRPREELLDKKFPFAIFDADYGTNLYNQARLHAGNGSIVDQALFYSRVGIDETGNLAPLQGTESLSDILEPIRKNGQLDALNRLLVSTRFANIKSEEAQILVPTLKNYKLPISMEDAQKEIANADPAIQEIAKKVTDFMDHHMKLLSGTAYDAPFFNTMQKVLGGYIPLQRIIDNSVAAEKSNTGIGAAEPSFLKQLTGSTSLKVKNPLAASVENMRTLFNFISYNNIGKSLDKFINSDRELAEVAGISFGKVVSTEANVKRIANIQESLSSELGRNISTNEVMQLTAMAEPFNPRKGVLNYWKDGVRREINIQNPDLLRAFQHMKSAEVDSVVRMLGIPAQLLGYGVTRNPVFSVFNAIRDTFEASLKSQYGTNALRNPNRDFLQPFIEVWKGGQEYQNMMTARGGAAGLLGSEGSVTKSLVDRLTGIKNYGLSDIDAILKKLAAPFEEASRLAEWSNARRAGADLTTAAMASRNITTDFSQMGASMSALSYMTKFLNPSIQSLSRDITVVKDNPTQYALRGIMGITMPSLMLWAANYGDQEVNDLRKGPNGNLYWHIRIPGTGEIVRLPKPFTAGQVFGTMFEDFADHISGNDPKQGAEMAKQLASSLNPAVVPQIVNLMVGMIGNKDLHYDMPVIPPGQAQLDARVQDSEYTTGVAKTIAEHTGISPFQIDFAIRNIFGTLGSETAKLYGSVKKNDKPDVTPGQLPFIGRFFADYPSRSVQPVMEFYSSLDKAKTILGTIKALENDPERLGAYIDANKDNLGKAQAYSQTLTEINRINADINQLRKIPNEVVDAKRKREIQDQLVKQIIMITRTVNKSVGSI